MAKKHLIDLDEAMEFIGLPCTELLSEDVNKLKELNKVLRYEFDSYVITRLLWKSEDEASSIDVPNFVIGKDIRNEEYKLNNINRLHFGYIADEMMKNIIGSERSMYVEDADQAAKILSEYKKTKHRFFIVNDDEIKIYRVSLENDKLKSTILPITILDGPIIDLTDIMSDQIGEESEDLEKAIGYLYSAFSTISNGTESEDLIVAFNNFDTSVKGGKICTGFNVYKAGGEMVENPSEYNLMDAITTENAMVEFYFDKNGGTVSVPLTLDMLSKNAKGANNMIMIHALNNILIKSVYPVLYTECIDLFNKPGSGSVNYDLVLMTVNALMV